MASIASAFEKLHGREATKQELQHLYRVRDALNLRDDDAIWSFYISFVQYQVAVANLPDLISQAARTAVASTEAAARAQVSAAIARATPEALKAITLAAERTTKAATFKQAAMWGVMMVTIFGAIGGCGAVYIQKTAYAAGVAEATEVAEVSNAAAKWGRTAQGRLAYAYAASGQLDRWMNCTHPGFRTEGGICYPDRMEDGRIMGWPLDPKVSRKKRKR